MRSFTNDLLWASLAVEGGHLQPSEVEAALRASLGGAGSDLAQRLAASVPAEIRRHLDRLVADKECFLPELSPPGEGRTEWSTLPSEGPQPLPPQPAAVPLLPQRLDNPTTVVVERNAGGEDCTPGSAPEGRFERVELHAEGGIGRVWRARDTFLQRDLALKELLPRCEHEPVVRRFFLQEARLTGQLEHPGIVPIHDLLTEGPEQRPFYLMRFLQGRTLSAAVQEHHQSRQARRATPLERNRLLSAFVQVCQTVAFAHARGVLHRDLKGANIHLGDFGEVVVLDWGLALPMEDGVAQAGSGVAGTPAYLAPEQASGSAVLGPQADVFGLGAILHEILTGAPPTHSSLRGQESPTTFQRMKARIEEDVIPPRQLTRGVHPALDAICCKALARDPARRYAGAADLARDVQAFLADEPVEAYREPWTARVGRWARRHKPLVAGLAALVLAGLVGLGVTTLLVSQEQRRTEAAAERARQHFRQAREVVDIFFVKVTEDRLLHEAGLQPLRQDLLNIAKGYYERFLGQDQGDPSLQADLGGTLYQLASVTRELGEPALARRQLQDALERFEALAKSQPGEPQHRLHLAMARNRLGSFHESAGESEQAEAAFRQALPDLREVAKGGSDEASKYLAYCLGNLAMLRLRRADLTPADLSEVEDLLRQSLEQYRRRTQKRPDDLQALDDQAGGHTNLAVLFVRRGQRQEALEEMRRAMDIHQSLVKKNPRAVAFRRHLSKSWNNIGGLLGPTSEAEDALKEALRLRDQIAAGNPLVSDYQRELAEMWQSLGIHYYKRRAATDNDQALRARLVVQADEAFKNAQTRFAELVKEVPENLVLQAGQGMALASLGDLWGEQKPKEAVASYRHAYGVLKKVLEKNYHAPEARNYFRNSAWGLAEDADAGKDWSAALGYWLDALKMDDREAGIREGTLRTLEKAHTAGHFEVRENRAILERLRTVPGLSKDKGFQKLAGMILGS